MEAERGSDPPSELDPETDAIDRFERMVETQIDTLEGIDDKAAHVTRFVALLLGVVFTGLSLALRFGGTATEIDSAVTMATFAIGIVGLLGSLGFAVVALLSSAFEYGPNEAIGDHLAEYDFPDGSYRTILLRSYSAAIRRNRLVVRTNARRFRNALAFLIVGVVSFALGGTFVVVDIGFVTETAVLLVTALVTGRLFAFVVAEEYLTLDYQVIHDE